MRRAAGLLGYARMPVRVRKRASQNPSCTPCNTASLDVYRAPPNSKRLGMSSAFFPPFLPFPRRLTGILRRDHTPAGACALTPPAAPYNGDRGGSMARYPTGRDRTLANSHIRQRCVLDPNQGFFDRSQETTVGLAQADLKSRFGCVRCLIDNISPAFSWSACGGYSPGLAAGQLAPLGE